MKFELEPYNRGAADAELLNDLRGVASKLGKQFVTKVEYNAHGRWCSATLQGRFGTWCRANELAGLRKIRNFDATQEDCLADIRLVAEKLGQPSITVPEYRLHGKFSGSLVARRCGSWTRAIGLAGLAVSDLYNKPASNEELFENLERLWEALGRQPKRVDFVRPLSKYSSDCYSRRFGSLRKALEAFVAAFDSQYPPHQHEATEQRAVDQRAHAAIYQRTSRCVSWRLRFLVMRRDDFRCRICGVSPAIRPGAILVVDHVRPWADGGETTLDNLQTLCETCNGGKSDLPMAEE